MRAAEIGLSNLAATTRHAMALLALLFAMLAGPANAAFAADHGHAAAILAEHDGGSSERPFEPSGDREDGAGDDAALALCLPNTRAPLAGAGPASVATSSPPRDVPGQAYRARAPPLG